MGPVSEASTPVRVDTWLWATRLAKTRALAHDAVKGGRVDVNGRTVKPSRNVGPGDRIDVSTDPLRRTVVVLATAERRVSAPLAALLYEETAESRERRARLAAEARLAFPAGVDRGGRPTKRDRRRFEQAMRGRRREA